MRIGLRALTGAVLSLAMLAGDVSTLSLTPAAASAAGRGGGGGYHGGGGFHGGGYRGGGYGGYRGGYGGYRGYGGYYGGYGGFGFGDFLLGAAIVGGVAAVASANEPYYDGGYTNYQTYPAPVYSAPQAYAPPGAYAPPAGYAPPGEYADNNGYAEGQAQQAAPSNDPVEQCSRAAERQGQARGGYARVIGIDHVDPRQNGAKVVGILEVNGPRDGNGNGPSSRTKFSCTADYGQITALRLG